MLCWGGAIALGTHFVLLMHFGLEMRYRAGKALRAVWRLDVFYTFKASFFEFCAFIWKIKKRN
ncbi:MAG: hypothetical protein C0424_04195 [Sphingobacteriaceae bacterium]|nr:hypothetical protein [Sphingobacteriaceae bacterium]